MPCWFLIFSKINFLESMRNYGKYARFMLFFFSVSQDELLCLQVIDEMWSHCHMGACWVETSGSWRSCNWADGADGSGYRVASSRKASWQIRSESEISLVRIPGWQHLSLSLACELVFQFIRSSNKCLLGISSTPNASQGSVDTVVNSIWLLV